MERLNKKIKNATAKVYDGISFKSLFEVATYKVLTECGFCPRYETEKYVIVKGFVPTIPFYTKDKNTRMLKSEMGKVRDITYTPDFTFDYKDYKIVIECKGFENDVFPLKKKLFRKYLESFKNYMFFEVFNQRQLKQSIEIIGSL